MTLCCGSSPRKRRRSRPEPQWQSEWSRLDQVGRFGVADDGGGGEGLATALVLAPGARPGGRAHRRASCLATTPSSWSVELTKQEFCLLARLAPEPTRREPDAHAGLPRLPAAAQAGRGGRRALRRQRVGVGSRLLSPVDVRRGPVRSADREEDGLADERLPLAGSAEQRAVVGRGCVDVCADEGHYSGAPRAAVVGRSPPGPGMKVVQARDSMAGPRGWRLLAADGTVGAADYSPPAGGGARRGRRRQPAGRRASGPLGAVGVRSLRPRHGRSPSRSRGETPDRSGPRAPRVVGARARAGCRAVRYRGGATGDQLEGALQALGLCDDVRSGLHDQLRCDHATTIAQPAALRIRECPGLDPSCRSPVLRALGRVEVRRGQMPLVPRRDDGAERGPCGGAPSATAPIATGDQLGSHEALRRSPDSLPTTA